MNKLEELILKEYDLKVGDTIFFTEMGLTAKLKIVQIEESIICRDINNYCSDRTLVNMFNTPNEIKVEKIKTYTKNLTCNNCRNCKEQCPLYNIGCIEGVKTNIYDFMKKVVDIFYFIDFVDDKVQEDE